MKTIKFETELPIKVDLIEQRYNAKYVGDFCIKDQNGYFIPETVAIFWQESPPEDYGHYFAIFIRNGKVMITDGSTAFDSPIIAAVANDGEIVYSRDRWDMRHSKDGSIFIDGGRDYVKTNGSKFCELKVIGPDIFITEKENEKC